MPSSFGGSAARGTRYSAGDCANALEPRQRQSAVVRNRRVMAPHGTNTRPRRLPTGRRDARSVVPSAEIQAASTDWNVRKDTAARGMVDASALERSKDRATAASGAGAKTAVCYVDTGGTRRWKRDRARLRLPLP